MLLVSLSEQTLPELPCDHQVLLAICHSSASNRVSYAKGPGEAC